MKNYGIFKATHNVYTKDVDRDRITRLWDVVEADEEIGAPIETFETEAEALEALAKYKSEEYEGSGYLAYTVYFAAELEEDGYCFGDGVEVAPLPKLEYVVYEAGTAHELFRAESREEAEQYAERAEEESDICTAVEAERAV